MTAKSLKTFPIHLGLGAKAAAEPAFTGELAWYEGYIQRHATDGTESRLVAEHSFSAPWDVWEMHPKGEEVVICISGAFTLIQEIECEADKRIVLKAGEYAINPRGVWHTAETDEAATAIFITVGAGTQHRPVA